MGQFLGSTREREWDMTGPRHDSNSDLDFITGRRMQAAQAKWSRLTVDDLSRIRDQDQLIARVADRYSLPSELARTDVVIWESETRW